MQLGIPRSFGAVVGVADTEVLGPNPRRVSVTFSSDTAVEYWIAFGQPAVVNQGIRVPPNTTALVLGGNTGREAITGAIHVIAGGAATIPITEMYEACPCKGWGDEAHDQYVTSHGFR